MGESRLNIAYYVTGHGLGHATRVVEICKHLVSAGHNVHIVTAAQATLFTREIASQQLTVRRAVLDCGSKQQDAFSVDMKGTLDLYQESVVERREAILETEVDWLKTSQIDLVALDIVPIACAAAAAAGLPAVGVSNFSWDFIYSEYASTLGSHGNSYRKMVWQIAEDYACANVLLRLPGYSPMPAFGEVIDVPLVVRHAQRSKTQVFIELGLPEDIHLCLFIYGGQPPGQWELKQDALPEGWVCVVCSGGKPILSDKQLPSNFRLASPDDFIPDLVNAADCVLGKIGYGTTSECLAHATPFVFIRRDYFNEEPFLRKQLEVHGLGVEMKRRDFLAGNWAPFLSKTLTMESNFEEPTDGAEVVARMLEHFARQQGPYASLQADGLATGLKQSLSNGGSLPSLDRGRSVSRAGAGRLRDAIVFGYMMQRHRARGKVEVPEWYVQAPRSSSPDAIRTTADQRAFNAAELENQEAINAFDITHGMENLARCSDTRSFIGMLHQLCNPIDEDADPPELPEKQAAKSLFCWEDEVIVTRAPGRLDVMGGIGDYSGCLVLQKPTAEACHVACQRQPLPKQRLWKHVENRHKLKGGPVPALRVVSFDADDTNRSPTFDMDLTELMRDGQPISYPEAQQYFKSDPATRWAAYVAGPLVVLMHELGLRYDDGLSLLLSSAVPEGKGVSSSAAVEVAVMQAICAAYNVQLDGRHLALLCQKVENLVVGAPCGVMDQMASSLGEEGALMAMSCQPAEVEPEVPIPAHLKFWGLDSGVRHSIGGADYASVRAGAFMGFRMMVQRKAEQGPEPLGNGYLCSISPSLYAQHYEEHIPDSITGADFLHRYNNHYDHATQVSEAESYAVRQPTAHAVYENHRVRCFRQMLLGPLDTTEQLLNLGELMYQSHAGYSRCGLGSDGTERLVALVRQEQAQAQLHQEPPVLYGAKITGGGSGGSVCILGAATAEAEAAVQRIVARYAEETGFNPYEFRGTSIGANRFGHLVLRRLSQ